MNVIWKQIDNQENIKKIVEKIYHEDIFSFCVFRYCGYDGDESQEKDVYKIDIDGCSFILKKAEEIESDIYLNFLNKNNFNTPKVYGYSDGYLLIEYINGTDLCIMDENKAKKSSKSVGVILKFYFNKEIDDGRFKTYLNRIKKRAESLTNEPLLKEVYDLFIQRQLDCPRSLCNGDFLPFNGIYSNNKVYIIDWGFGGFLPYSLDVARFIAHGRNEDPTTEFPFQITENLCQIYVKGVYEELKDFISYEQYIFDIKVALLNEYIEFLEYYFNNPNVKKNSFYKHYYDKAISLAKKIKNTY